jgi:prevent-host-death family protein
VFTSNQKGALAEAKIVAAALEQGIPVLRPMQEHGRYDLAFEVAGQLLRVQCKWGRLERESSVISVAIQSSWHSPAGYVFSPYAEGEIDLLAAYCGDLDRCYLLPGERATARRAIHLRLTEPRNAQRACINFASEYEFAGAVAQLEERLHGMQEARGSSPLSSTPSPATVQAGCHQFRNHFGYYLEQAAAGHEVEISRRGRPYARLVPVQPQLMAA